MKKYLLDTNALLWSLNDDYRLSEKARSIIEVEDNIFVSDVSLWEIAIKNNIGKLDIDGTIYDIVGECKKLEFLSLNIKTSHFECLRKLELLHQDPFDRLIISQAIIENMTVITSDHIIPRYDIDCIW